LRFRAAGEQGPSLPLDGAPLEERFIREDVEAGRKEAAREERSGDQHLCADQVRLRAREAALQRARQLARGRDGEPRGGEGLQGVVAVRWIRPPRGYRRVWCAQRVPGVADRPLLGGVP